METVKRSGSMLRNWKLWAVVGVALVAVLVYWGTRPAVEMSGNDYIIFGQARGLSKKIDKAVETSKLDDFMVVINSADKLQEMNEIPAKFGDKWVAVLDDVIGAAGLRHEGELLAAQKGLQDLTETILKAND